VLVSEWIDRPSVTVLAQRLLMLHKYNRETLSAHELSFRQDVQILSDLFAPLQRPDVSSPQMEKIHST